MIKLPESARRGIPVDLAASIATQREAFARDRNDVEALAGLARLLMTAGALEEAARHYRALLQVAPQRADARVDAARIARMLCLRGFALTRSADADGAIRALRTAIALDLQTPVKAYLWLGGLLQQKGDQWRALAVYRKACEVHPARPAPFIRLGWTLHTLHRVEPAIAALRRAVEVSPGKPRALRELTELLIKERRALDEALELCRRVQKLEPDNPDAIANEAVVLELQGEVRSAYDLLVPLARSGRTSAHVALVFGKVCERLDPPSDAALPLLHAALEKPDLPGEARTRLQRTLASLCDALGRSDEAFRALEEAKSGHAGQGEESKEELLGVIQRSLTCFTPERMAGLPRARHGSELPVFIVGMPRSGTSLVEQILDAHPKVHGAGELTTIIGLARSRLGAQAQYPACFDEWTQQRVDASADLYLRQLHELAPVALRVTDKMPFNFLHLGMIEVLFPRARVIHCMRNPLDTCVSCYFNEFSTNLSIFGDLTTLGRYYRGYRAVMEHWRGMLSIPVFELRYENLLSDPERIVREMVAFCGLEWDAACMAFHQSQRPVKTFSYHQVRKPLYSSSVGRFRVYDAHLGALKDALGEALVAEAQAAT